MEVAASTGVVDLRYVGTPAALARVSTRATYNGCAPGLITCCGGQVVHQIVESVAPDAL